MKRTLLCSAILLMLTTTSLAGARDFSITTFIGNDGRLIDRIVIGPGLPPLVKMSSAAITKSAVRLSDVPAFDWCYGCSATSAAMLAGYYDRHGYPNMYAGPANGGVIPLTNTIWGSGECPLSATHKGIDGRSIRGHVDDYWVSSESTASDPYISNGWTEHTWGDCTGDYMGTNQSRYENIDGATTFYNYPSGDALCDYDAHADGKIDGTYGLRKFIESRGYAVDVNCNQYIAGYEGNSSGYTLALYQSEIDADRPVLIHVKGHTMLGVGYDSGSSTIYLHDTWDHSVHQMTWGGSYSGMQHISVSYIHLKSICIPACSGKECGDDGCGGSCGTCASGAECRSGKCCTCSSGACCDGCTYKSTSFICDSDTGVYEERCQSDACGADAQTRTQRRHCSGSSSSCNGATSFGLWSVKEACDADTLCSFIEATASCNEPCEFGCKDGRCCDCNAGDCCDLETCRFLDASVVCNAKADYQEQCESDVCGADIQYRDLRQYCTGSSSVCEGAIFWGDWTLKEVCHADEMCQPQGDAAACIPCQFGCRDGACCDCAEGSCCDAKTCRFRDAETICNDHYQDAFFCAESGCGGSARQRTMVQYCTGSESGCGGATQWRPAETIEICAADAVCAGDGETFAKCRSCTLGCRNGSCCECDSGPCCDGCRYLPSTEVCAEGLEPEYACQSGDCGTKVLRSTKKQYCSGNSPDCNGVKEWDAFREAVVQCRLDELCHATGGGGMAACEKCSYGCGDGVCRARKQSDGGGCAAGAAGAWYMLFAVPLLLRRRCATTARKKREG